MSAIPPSVRPGLSLLEEAADWTFRLQAQPDDAELRRAHERWLAADDGHAAAWRAVQRSWRVTGQLRPAGGRQDPARRRLPVRRRFALAVGALAACLALALVVPAALLHLQADHVTATAENRAVILADGSAVTLGGDSALAAAFEGNRRNVTLLRGEAHFEVAHDSARPFVIVAGPLSVTVTGTAFDVTMSERSVAVAVASGGVQVRATAGASRQLQAGERLVIDRRTGVASLTRLPPADVGLWREGRLVLQDQPLREALAQLERYHRGRIVILGAAEELERQRVSGVFDLDDPRRALRAMLATAGPDLRGLKIRQITPYLIVLNK